MITSCSLFAYKPLVIIAFIITIIIIIVITVAYIIVSVDYCYQVG